MYLSGKKCGFALKISGFLSGHIKRLIAVEIYTDAVKTSRKNNGKVSGKKLDRGGRRGGWWSL